MDGVPIPIAGLAVSLSLMTAVWLLSLVRDDASVVDAFWGPGFVVVAWVYFALTEPATPRKQIVVGLVTVWGLRLAIHILWRARGKGEDYRYRAMRESWGARFRWVSLFTVFLLQGTILWIVAFPLYVAQRTPVPERLTSIDALGMLCFAVGFFFEAVGDWQLARFKADPENRGKLLTTGLWRFTRHPNYFGDALVWWGLFLMAFATPRSYWTVFSPVLMTFLLMKVSGVRLLEKTLADTKPGYREYVERTNAFVPWFPRGRADRSGT